MSHPCLVTLDSKSVPRSLFAGDQLVQVALPAGARVLYPRARPAQGGPSTTQLVSLALSNPLGAPALASQLKRGMKVTVVLDAVFLPGSGRPDPRAQILDVLLPLLSAHDVTDVSVVVASGVGRRRTGMELRALVGRRAFKALWPNRLHSHDPEARELLVPVASASNVEAVELPRRVVDSDLLISIQLRGGQLGEFGGPLYRGIGGVGAYVRHARDGHLASIAPEEVEPYSKLPTFAIDAVLDGPRFIERCDFLSCNEDELTPRQTGMLRALQTATTQLPHLARRALLDQMAETPTVTAVVAGAPALVAEHATGAYLEQNRVPISGQADVLVMGVPHATAHNQGAGLNPLLVLGAAQGYLFNLHHGAPLAKAGGTLILTHPCTDKFDRQHAAYAQFMHQEVAQTHDKHELAARCLREYAVNPALVQMFRNGDAYHPVHPYLTWMSGEAARNHLGRVIVVGADNEYTPHMLGFETAPSLNQALYRARDGAGVQQDVLCLHSPMSSIGDVREAP
jgi:lactate racemase